MSALLPPVHSPSKHGNSATLVSPLEDIVRNLSVRRQENELKAQELLLGEHGQSPNHTRRSPAHEPLQTSTNIFAEALSFLNESRDVLSTSILNPDPISDPGEQTNPELETRASPQRNLSMELDREANHHLSTSIFDKYTTNGNISTVQAPSPEGDEVDVVERNYSLALEGDLQANETNVVVDHTVPTSPERQTSTTNTHTRIAQTPTFSPHTIPVERVQEMASPSHPAESRLEPTRDGPPPPPPPTTAATTTTITTTSPVSLTENTISVHGASPVQKSMIQRQERARTPLSPYNPNVPLATVRSAGDSKGMHRMTDWLRARLNRYKDDNDNDGTRPRDIGDLGAGVLPGYSHSIPAEPHIPMSQADDGDLVLAGDATPSRPRKGGLYSKKTQRMGGTSFAKMRPGMLYSSSSDHSHDDADNHQHREHPNPADDADVSGVSWQHEAIPTAVPSTPINIIPSVSIPHASRSHHKSMMVSTRHRSRSPRETAAMRSIRARVARQVNAWLADSSTSSDSMESTPPAPALVSSQVSHAGPVPTSRDVQGVQGSTRVVHLESPVIVQVCTPAGSPPRPGAADISHADSRVTGSFVTEKSVSPLPPLIRGEMDFGTHSPMVHRDSHAIKEGYERHSEHHGHRAGVNVESDTGRDSEGHDHRVSSRPQLRLMLGGNHASPQVVAESIDVQIDEPPNTATTTTSPTTTSATTRPANTSAVPATPARPFNPFSYSSPSYRQASMTGVAPHASNENCTGTTTTTTTTSANGGDGGGAAVINRRPPLPTPSKPAADSTTAVTNPPSTLSSGSGSGGRSGGRDLRLFSPLRASSPNAFVQHSVSTSLHDTHGADGGMNRGNTGPVMTPSLYKLLKEDQDTYYEQREERLQQRRQELLTLEAQLLERETALITMQQFLVSKESEFSTLEKQLSAREATLESNWAQYNGAMDQLNARLRSVQAREDKCEMAWRELEDAGLQGVDDVSTMIQEMDIGSVVVPRSPGAAQPRQQAAGDEDNHRAGTLSLTSSSSSSSIQ